MKYPQIHIDLSTDKFIRKPVNELFASKVKPVFRAIYLISDAFCLYFRNEDFTEDDEARRQVAHRMQKAFVEFFSQLSVLIISKNVDWKVVPVPESIIKLVEDGRFYDNAEQLHDIFDCLFDCDLKEGGEEISNTGDHMAAKRFMYLVLKQTHLKCSVEQL